MGKSPTALYYALKLQITRRKKIRKTVKRNFPEFDFVIKRNGQ